MSRFLLLPLLALTLVAGCRPPEKRVTTVTSPDTRGLIQHVVLCWLKEPGSAINRAQIIGTSLGFRDLPGVVSVSAGETLPSTRTEVDTTFDVAIIMTFRDEASLRGYENHPAHKSAVESVLKPLVSRIVIYDFANAR